MLFRSKQTALVVEHGKSGLLSPPGDAAALAANIERLMTDAALRAQMGEYGRRQVEQRFIPARLAKDVSAIYQTLLGRVPS